MHSNIKNTLSCLLLSLVLVPVAKSERIWVYDEPVAASFDLAQLLLLSMNQEGEFKAYPLEGTSHSGQRYGGAFISLGKGKGPVVAATIALGKEGEVWLSPAIRKFAIFEGTIRDAQAALRVARGESQEPVATPKVVSAKEEPTPETVRECRDLERSLVELRYDIATLEAGLETNDSGSEVLRSSRERSLKTALTQVLAKARNQSQVVEPDESTERVSPSLDYVPIAELERQLARIRRLREELEHELAGWGIY